MLRGSAAGATQTHEAPVGSYQPTILKLIVNKLSRHKRYYLLIPYSIFPIEENVSSIIDKFRISAIQKTGDIAGALPYLAMVLGLSAVLFTIAVIMSAPKKAHSAK